MTLFKTVSSTLYLTYFSVNQKYLLDAIKALIRLKQFIRGFHNDTFQTDILPKASQLKIYEEVIEHAEAFRAALSDQQTL